MVLLFLLYFDVLLLFLVAGVSIFLPLPLCEFFIGCSAVGFPEENPAENGGKYNLVL